MTSVAAVATSTAAAATAATTKGDDAVTVTIDAKSAKALAKEEVKAKKASFWKLHKHEMYELLPYLWPKGKPMLRVMMTASVMFLLASKVSNVASPIALKAAVDKIAAGEDGYLQPILI